MTLRPQGLSKKKKEWWAPSFSPADVSSVLMWLDDPAIFGNVIESANKVSEWTGEVGGVNADQSTGADRGLRTGSEIFFAGSPEFMTLADLFALASGDLQGEIFIVLKTPADGVIGREFGAGDTGTDNNFLAYFINGVTVGGEHRMDVSFNDGGVSDVIRSDTDMGADTLVLVNLSSNGSRWRMGLNGSEETFIITGLNSGKWIGNIAGVDSISLAQIPRASPLFGEGRFYSFVYSNAELNTINRDNINNFLLSSSRSWGPIS